MYPQAAKECVARARGRASAAQAELQAAQFALFSAKGAWEAAWQEDVSAPAAEASAEDPPQHPFFSMPPAATADALLPAPPLPDVGQVATRI